jgi:hypothetical protein
MSHYTVFHIVVRSRKIFSGDEHAPVSHIFH